jgi:hypothetical protein
MIQYNLKIDHKQKDGKSLSNGISRSRGNFEQSAMQNIIDSIITESIRHRERRDHRTILSRPIDGDSHQFRTIKGGITGEVEIGIKRDSSRGITKSDRINSRTNRIDGEAVELMVMGASQKFGQELSFHGTDARQLVRIRMDHETGISLTMEDPNVGETFGIARKTSEDA